jgi:hypothetical protein
MGIIAEPSSVIQVMPMTVGAGNFTMPRGQALLGFNLRPSSGSGFDPGLVQINRGTGATATPLAPTFQSVDTGADNSALTIVSMNSGQFSATVRSQLHPFHVKDRDIDIFQGTTGNFTLEVFLVGDANGDFVVNATDINLINDKQGIARGQTGYLREADVNLDGTINTQDLTLARQNLGVRTSIRPLTLQTTLSENGATITNGVLRTGTFRVDATANRPVTFVGLDLNTDGYFEVNQKTKNNHTAFDLTTTPGLGSVRLYTRSGSFTQQVFNTVNYVRGNAITDWNATLLQLIARTATNPPVASRDMAIVQGAIFDALNAVDHRFVSYLTTQDAPTGANLEAIVAGAAFQTLINLFPNQTATINAALARNLSFIADGTAKTEGFNFGVSVGQEFLDARAHDNSTLIVPYTPGTGAGAWQPTPAAFAPALLPNWPQVTPFTMTSGDQFRMDGPPALTSQEWADAFNETKDLGSAKSTQRTSDQTELALFWSDGGGTVTPPGHWNVIAQDITARASLNDLVGTARTFALLDYAMADAAIASWDMKYAYNFWRPITAIRNAGLDNNVDTDADLTWTPLIATPPFPEYTSGHSTFSGAAAEVLTALYGGDVSFRSYSPASSNILRSFSNFEEAAAEAGRSRVYGGIHFEFSNQDGQTVGHLIGDQVIKNFLQANS